MARSIDRYVTVFLEQHKLVRFGALLPSGVVFLLLLVRPSFLVPRSLPLVPRSSLVPLPRGVVLYMEAVFDHGQSPGSATPSETPWIQTSPHYTKGLWQCAGTYVAPRTAEGVRPLLFVGLGFVSLPTR